MDFAGLVQNLGFPIGIAVYLIWENRQQAKQRYEDMKGIAVKSVEAINSSTDAIIDSNAYSEKTDKALSDNSRILNEVKGVLLKRGMRNNDGSNS